MRTKAADSTVCVKLKPQQQHKMMKLIILVLTLMMLSTNVSGLTFILCGIINKSFQPVQVIFGSNSLSPNTMKYGLLPGQNVTTNFQIGDAVMAADLGSGINPTAWYFNDGCVWGTVDFINGFQGILGGPGGCFSDTNYYNITIGSNYQLVQTPLVATSCSQLS